MFIPHSAYAHCQVSRINYARMVYMEKIARHHEVMVAAMNCKQSSSMDSMKTLSLALDAIERYWLPEKK